MVQIVIPLFTFTGRTRNKGNEGTNHPLTNPHKNMKKGTIDEIIFYKNDADSCKIGLCFDYRGECAVMMRFMDGEAVEVDEDGKDIPFEESPIILSYPRKKELTQDMRNEIIEYTGRYWITSYDVALKYGKPNRLNWKS